MEIARFIIPIKPVTKKNGSQMVWAGSKPRLIPSNLYINYEKQCKPFIPRLLIDQAINIKALFYMPSRRRIDLPNLQEALHDVLTKYECIVDDNCNVIVSTDGSRVLYDKNNPRTEVLIETSNEEILRNMK